MRSSRMLPLWKTAGILLLSSSLLVPSARADLRYYLYSEEEEHTNNEESSVIVLRSIGSLPLDKSTFSETGDACPEMVWKAGGVNPKYLCAGAVHPEDGNAQANFNATDPKSNLAFFPLEPIVDANEEDQDRSFLPFKFAAFTRSRGTPSGLIAWRNVLVVDRAIATSEDQPQFLDAVSLGEDTSNHAFNTDALASFSDGQVVAEWYLLTEKDGEPITDGGKIQVIKGKPPSTTAQKDDTKDASTYNGVTESVGATLATANDVPVSLTTAPAVNVSLTQAPKPQQYCQSITETLCSDENNDRYGTLCSLMMQVGLDEMLDLPNGNLFTLYAPTNDGFWRAFDRYPSLLSGHDLTKLLLNHVIVTSSAETTQSASIGTTATDTLKYEDMICGAKLEMASGQYTKIGCDANAEVAFVTGAGNGGHSAPRPKFTNVDQQTCNGVIHTVDFIVFPLSQQNVHVHGTMPSTAVDVGSSVTSASSQEPNKAAITLPDSSTNQLDQADIMSFFQQTKQDLLDESGPVIPPTVVTTNMEAQETFESASASSSSSSEQERKGKPQGDLDTMSQGFHSFFGRTTPNDVDNAPDRDESGRPGNLRRR